MRASMVSFGTDRNMATPCQLEIIQYTLSFSSRDAMIEPSILAEDLIHQNFLQKDNLETNT